MTATKLEWTDRTWNPVTGCTKVSPGCDHCYAENIARRFAGSKAFPNGFGLTLHPERLDQPLRWRKPARVFVNSMSDLFHDEVPDEFVARVWAAMALGHQHTYQVLTKRHGRMRSLLLSPEFEEQVRDKVRHHDESPAYRREVANWPLPNVWLGVSVEDQKRADLRVPALMETPAAVRFLSCEPLLGPVELNHLHSHCPTHDFPGGFCVGPCPDRRWPDWVIVGGESGSGARPMHPAWARSLRDQCETGGVPFHFKQWGESAPLDQLPDDAVAAWEVRNGVGYPGSTMCKVGKKAAGRGLDGRTWDEFPAGVTTS